MRLLIEIAVADDFAVLPVRTGVAHVVLQRRPGGDAPAVHEPGGNEQPAAVTDDGDRFAGAIHLLHELLRALLDAHRIAVDRRRREA